MFILNPYRYATGGGGGGLVFLGSAPAVTAFNGGSVTVNFSNLVDASGSAVTLQENDFLVCAFANNNGAYDISTSSSGWTEEADLDSVSTRVTNLGVYTKRMSSSPDTSFVGAGPGGSPTGCVAIGMAFRGVHTVTALDVATTTATGTSTARPNPPSITPSTAGSIIVVVGAGAATTGSALGNPGDLSSTTNHFRSGYIDEGVDMMLAMGIKTDWVSGAFDPGQWTGPSDAAEQSWASATLVLRPA